MNEPFDESTLTEIAHLICGDDGPLVYRKGYEITRFLARAGRPDAPEYDGSTSRHAFTLDYLRDLRAEPDAIERIVLRLADPREYFDLERERKATLERLNNVLAFEGRRVEYRAGRPVLTEHEINLDDGPELPRVELKVAVSDVVEDPDLAAAIQLRLDEARIAYEHGAYLSTIIMLGSLLEGALIHAALTCPAREPLPRPAEKLSLEKLVDIAHSNGWIDFDAKMASHLVRHYRNMVHPHAQVRTNHVADIDTADICWPVVNAALNDLAATAPTKRATA